MLDIIQKLEERTNRLIVELESSRVTMRQLEVETDGLRITAADRDRLEAELAATRGQLASLENDTILVRRERDSLLDDRNRLGDAETEVQALREKLEEIANTHHAALEGVRSESEVLRNELDAIRDAAEKSSAQFRELAAEAEASRLALASAEAKVVELEGLLNSAGAKGEEIEQLQTELDHVTKHRDQLVAERESHVKLANDLKWRNGELIAEVKLAEEARQGAVERATGAERVAREAREWAAELEAELSKFGEDRDRLTSELAAAVAAKDEAVAAASSVNTAEAEALRRENEDLRLRLNESIARDQRTRERLDSLIGRIEKAETLIEQTELAIHGNP